MKDIYAPVMRALVVAALVLATATLMFVTVNTARASARAALLRAGRTTPVYVAPASRGQDAAPLRQLNS
jgi:hypothetical protein